VRARPAPRTVTAAGQGLNLCFGVWRGEGIFLTQSRNSFPWGIEPGTWEVPLGCLDHSAKAPVRNSFPRGIQSWISSRGTCALKGIQGIKKGQVTGRSNRHCLYILNFLKLYFYFIYHKKICKLEIQNHSL
jgi:hypothetical protein